MKNPNRNDDMGTYEECSDCPLKELLDINETFSCAYGWKKCPGR